MADWADWRERATRNDWGGVGQLPRRSESCRRFQRGSRSLSTCLAARRARPDVYGAPPGADNDDEAGPRRQPCTSHGRTRAPNLGSGCPLWSDVRLWFCLGETMVRSWVRFAEAFSRGRVAPEGRQRSLTISSAARGGGSPQGDRRSVSAATTCYTGALDADPPQVGPCGKDNLA